MESTPEDLELDLIVSTKKEADAKQRAHRQALQALSSRWGDRHRKRVDALTKELGSDSPDAGADEQAIYRLAATCAAVCEQLGRAQLQLGERIERLVDEHKALLVVAKAMREVTSVQRSTLRSVQELLSAAATVRAQRKLVDSHAKRTWHEDVGGASQPPPRRSPSARPEAAN